MPSRLTDGPAKEEGEVGGTETRDQRQRGMEGCVCVCVYVAHRTDDMIVGLLWGG